MPVDVDDGTAARRADHQIRAHVIVPEQDDDGTAARCAAETAAPPKAVTPAPKPTPPPAVVPVDVEQMTTEPPLAAPPKPAAPPACKTACRLPLCQRTRRHGHRAAAREAACRHPDGRRGSDCHAPPDVISIAPLEARPEPEMPAAPAMVDVRLARDTQTFGEVKPDESGIALDVDRLVVYHADQVIETLALNRRVTVIGRDVDNDVILPSKNVSRRHARIERTEEGDYRVVDMGATNRCRLDDVRLSPNVPTRWEFGQVLYVGDFSLRLEAAPARFAGCARSACRVVSARAQFVPDDQHDAQQR
ncbi:MAG: FHA domain-containing protein [Anaerolineae bacterium]